MKIDLHSHILPETWPDFKKKFGYGGWIHMEHDPENPEQARMMRDNGTLFRVVERNLWDPEKRLKEMEETGVTVQVISTVPVMFNYWARPQDTLEVAKFLNDHIASVVQKYPKKFIGLGSVPLQDPVLAAEETRRCIVELGLSGIEIGTHVNSWNLDTSELDVFYKVVEDLDCPLFVHPWDMETGGRMQKFWLPWLVGMPTETTIAICSVLLGGVMERFPKLKFCFSHGAGTFPYTLGRISHGYSVRPDLVAVDNPTPPHSYLGRFYSDALVHKPESLRLLVDTLGEDKVVMGSDYPFPLGESVPGDMIESMKDFDKNLKEKLLADNALEFLGLPKSQFM